MVTIFGQSLSNEGHPCATVSFTQYRRHAVHNSTLNQAHLATRKTPHDMSAEHLCLPLFVHVNLNCVLFPTHTAVYLLMTLLLKKHTNEYEGMITTRASNSLGHCQNYLAVSGKWLKFKQMSRLKPGVLLREARAGNTRRNSLAGPGNTMFDPNTWRPYLRILQNLGLVPENAEKPTILLKVQSLMNPIISWQCWGPLFGKPIGFCMFVHDIHKHLPELHSHGVLPRCLSKMNFGKHMFFFDWKPTMLKTMSKGCLVVNSKGKTKTVWTMLIHWTAHLPNV